MYTFENNKTKEVNTLSYNGMTGEWLLNTPTDVESIARMDRWETKEITPINGIDLEVTVNNINEMIEDKSDLYYLLDHIADKGNVFFNCNTALQTTQVENSQNVEIQQEAEVK